MVMRKILTLLFIVISIYGLKAQSVLDQAHKAYQDGDFEKAVNLYQQEIKMQGDLGRVSPQLYYNLGNAYFKANDLPEAILNYERALLYDPGDKAIRHNIEFANSKIEDRIYDADVVSMSHWFDVLQNRMSSNQWAKVSIVLFVLFLVSIALYLLANRMLYRKTGFYAGLVLLVMLIFTNVFAYGQRSKFDNRDTAIIMVGTAPVKVSPTLTSNDSFVLHAGTKVRILKVDGQWSEIEIANGNVGWVQSSKLEII